MRFCDVLCLMVVIEPTLHLSDWARCDESLLVFTCAVMIKVMLCVVCWCWYYRYQLHGRVINHVVLVLGVLYFVAGLSVNCLVCRMYS